VPGLDVPYVVAVVELDEQSGLRLLTNIVGCAPDEVAIDMPVDVEFVERGAAFIPVFRRARSRPIASSTPASSPASASRRSAGT
jgi:uncharacterized OB-fold protein